MRIAPTPSDTSVVVSSRRRENTQSGSTGSAARRSTSRNATISTAPMANAPMLGTESHAQA